MLWDAFSWVVDVMEVVLVIAAILVLGLTSVVVFLRLVGRFSSPPPELGSDPGEIDGVQPTAGDDSSSFFK